MDEILNQLGNAFGFVFGAPGKMVRTAMVGENPFKWSVGELWNGTDQAPAGGRDVLERWGWLDKNQPGLDWGDVGGGFAGLLMDPWTVVPAAKGATTARSLGGAAMGAAKPLAINAGIGAGIEGLMGMMPTAPPASQSNDDMLLAALLDMIERDAGTSYDN